MPGTGGSGAGGGGPRPALIELEPSADVERVVRLVERAGGRVLHAYPPYALVVELPPEADERLAGAAGVRAVSTGELPATRADGARAAVVAAWNAHLRAARPDASADAARGTRRGADLGWDAPGLLPPDPPPDVREALRRREREMHDDPRSHPEDPDRGS